jgi:hypothetical protein
MSTLLGGHLVSWTVGQLDSWDIKPITSVFELDCCRYNLSVRVAIDRKYFGIDAADNVSEVISVGQIPTAAAEPLRDRVQPVAAAATTKQQQSSSNTVHPQALEAVDTSQSPVTASTSTSYGAPGREARQSALPRGQPEPSWPPGAEVEPAQPPPPLPLKAAAAAAAAAAATAEGTAQQKAGLVGAAWDAVLQRQVGDEERVVANGFTTLSQDPWDPPSLDYLEAEEREVYKAWIGASPVPRGLSHTKPSKEYFSLGKTRPFMGDLQKPGQLKAMLEVKGGKLVPAASPLGTCIWLRADDHVLHCCPFTGGELIMSCIAALARRPERTRMSSFFSWWMRIRSCKVEIIIK